MAEREPKILAPRGSSPFPLLALGREVRLAEGAVGERQVGGRELAGCADAGGGGRRRARRWAGDGRAAARAEGADAEGSGQPEAEQDRTDASRSPDGDDQQEEGNLKFCHR